MGMTGSVTVDASGVDSVVVQIGANGLLAFAPPATHIRPGGHVRWVNMSNLTIHTVTSD
jgi:plastocyanin